MMDLLYTATWHLPYISTFLSKDPYFSYVFGCRGGYISPTSLHLLLGTTLLTRIGLKAIIEIAFYVSFNADNNCNPVS
jgi:hypothetical protein